MIRTSYAATSGSTILCSNSVTAECTTRCQWCYDRWMCDQSRHHGVLFGT